MARRQRAAGAIAALGLVVTAAVAIAAPASSASEPSRAGATRRPSGQVAIGDKCTGATDAARQIVSATRQVMKAEDAEGAILRVDVGDQTIVNRGLGLSQEGVPVSADMKFRPGAMAIPMLTTLLLQLQEKGKLSLDDTLSKYFQDFPNADRVTLRELASSTGGYPDYIQENPAFQAAQLAEPFRHWTDDELLHYAFAEPVVCDPGARFHYAHTNFIILARVIEKVTKQSMTHLIQTRFINPLGLHDTRISKEPAIPPPVMHAYSDERGVFEDATYWSPSWGLGVGMIMTSTARDMNTLIRAVGTGSLLSKDSQRQLVQPLSKGLPGAPTEIDYGLGIDLAHGWVFQNPVFNGYAGINAYLPSQKISIVIDNTHGPNAEPGVSISARIFKAITEVLTPNNQV